jgi:hypothetical protein
MPTVQKPTTQRYEGNGQADMLPVPGGNRLADRLRLAKSHEAPRIVKIVSIAPPQLGEDAYHGKIGEFLRAVSPHTEATDAAVVAHLLPAIGTLIGSGPTFYAGNPQPPRINFVVVGETNSGRKGTAASPVEELMILVDEDFWKMQRVGGMSSGEGLIVKVADQKDEDGNVIPVEKRLFVLEEEFCRVLANMSRQGNILSPIIRQAFDNGNLCTLTVNPRYAFGAHVSIVAHITPEELENRFDGIEAANGFGNRFLWFYVASDKVISHPHPIPAKVFQDFAKRLRIASGLKPRQVSMDGAAQDLWEVQYMKLRQDRPGTAGAITARGPAIVLRLALIYAIVDKPHAPVIGVEHLRAALAVWQYNCESVDLLFDSKTGNKLGDRLYHLIRTHGPMATKEFHKHLSNEQKRSLTTTLERLKAEKLIHSETIQTKGRPRTVWQLGDGL